MIMGVNVNNVNHDDRDGYCGGDRNGFWHIERDNCPDGDCPVP